MNRRSVLQVGGAIVLLLAISIIVGRPGTDGPPLDPDAVNSSGTRALVYFLGESGLEVDRGLPDSDTDLVLILQDRLDDDSRAELLKWIRDGGDAVVADPASDLVDPLLLGTTRGDRLSNSVCEIDDLRDVEELDGRSLAVFDQIPNSEVCFSDGLGSFIVRYPEGEGRVTLTGGANPFTNANLDSGDNAVLAARLLAGTGLDGTDRESLSIVFTQLQAGGGDLTLGDLIGTNVKWFGWQLLVASGVLLLWAIRRFGPVVKEPPIVELPGSLAIRATAELHRRAETGQESLAVLQHDLQRRIRSHFRIPAEMADETAALVISEQTGVPHGEVQAALLGLPINLDEPTKSAGARLAGGFAGSSGRGTPKPYEQARALDQITRRLFPAEEDRSGSRSGLASQGPAALPNDVSSVSYSRNGPIPNEVTNV